MAERPLIGISRERTTASLKKLTENEDGLFDAIEEINRQIESKQPTHYKVLLLIRNMQGIKSPMLFDLGSAIVFDSLPDEEKDKLLTDDQLTAAIKSAVELNNVFLAESEEKVIDGSPWIRNMYSDSPGLRETLSILSVKFRNDGDVESLANGALFTFIPYYMRAESRQLDEMLSNFGSQSDDSGKK